MRRFCEVAARQRPDGWGKPLLALCQRRVFDSPALRHHRRRRADPVASRRDAMCLPRDRTYTPKALQTLAGGKRSATTGCVAAEPIASRRDASGQSTYFGSYATPRSIQQPDEILPKTPSAPDARADSQCTASRGRAPLRLRKTHCNLAGIPSGCCRCVCCLPEVALRLPPANVCDRFAVIVPCRRC
jgi:hypothetical protein